MYQASRREVVFDLTHGAFSAAFEALLGRTDDGYLRSVVRDHDPVWRARDRRRRTFAGRQSPAIASRDSRPRVLHIRGILIAAARTEIAKRTPEATKGGV